MRLMKVLLKVTIGLIVIALLIGLVWALIYLVYRYWRLLIAGILWVVIVASLALAAWAAISQIRIARRGGLDKINPILAGTFAQFSWPKKMLLLFSMVIEAVGLSLVLPAAIMSGVLVARNISKRRIGPIGHRLAATTQPLLQMQSSCILAFGLLYYFTMVWQTSIQFPLMILGIFVFISASLRLLAFTVSPNLIATISKQSRYRPYLFYVTLVLTFVPGIIVGTAFFNAAVCNAPFTLATLFNTGKAILFPIQLFRWPQDVYRDLSQNPSLIAPTAVGVMLSVSMLSSIVKWKEFRLSPGDILTVSSNMLHTGEPDEALRRLRTIKEKEQTKEETTRYAIVKAVALLMLNRPSDAMSAIEAHPPEDALVLNLSPCGQLLGMSTIFPVREAVVIRLLRQWLDEAPSKQQLIFIVGALLGNRPELERAVGVELQRMTGDSPSQSATALLAAMCLGDANGVLRSYRSYSDVNPSVQLFIEVIKIVFAARLTSSPAFDQKVVAAWLDHRMNVLVRAGKATATSLDVYAILIGLMTIRGIVAILMPERKPEIEAWLDEINDDLRRRGDSESLLKIIDAMRSVSGLAQSDLISGVPRDLRALMLERLQTTMTQSPETLLETLLHGEMSLTMLESIVEHKAMLPLTGEAPPPQEPQGE